MKRQKLGSAFSDSVITQKRTQKRHVSEEQQAWWLGVGRVLMFITVLCVGFFVLLWRLFDLTLVRGHQYRLLADGNRTRELVRHAPRGILRDRTGKPLVENIPYYRLNKPCNAPSTDDCTQSLTKEEGEQMEKRGLPSGYFLEVDYRRRYLMPTALSSVIGYTGELTEDELSDGYYTLRQYKRGDKIGRTGAEAVFEERLRGRDGKELVEVDANGTIIRTLGRDKEVPGEDVTLSIDMSLQQAAEDAFPKGEKGAVVVARPYTGEILALFSSPSFDLNAFSNGLSQKEYEALVDDPDQPMFNRAIGGIYPPGSTFKIVSSMAALEEGAINAKTIVQDNGVLEIGPYKFPNWYFLQYGKTEGPVDVVKALQRSNDIFFYRTGEWLGITRLVKWAKILGIGKPLGIELPGEASGLMPDPKWKKIRFDTKADRDARNDQWYIGDTYHISIGQGYLLTTPLQVSEWTNVIANKGAVCRPTIEKVDSETVSAKRCKEVVVKKDTIDLITVGMRKACEPGGTGWPLFDFAVRDLDEQSVSESSASASSIRVPVACKTGTAEYGDPKDRTHAWFTAFAPLRQDDVPVVDETGKKQIVGDPEISVVVLVEGAGEGSSVAGPVAKEIFKAWFER